MFKRGERVYYQNKPATVVICGEKNVRVKFDSGETIKIALSSISKNPSGDYNGQTSYEKIATEIEVFCTRFKYKFLYLDYDPEKETLRVTNRQLFPVANSPYSGIDLDTVVSLNERLKRGNFFNHLRSNID